MSIGILRITLRSIKDALYLRKGKQIPPFMQHYVSGSIELFHTDIHFMDGINIRDSKLKPFQQIS